MNVSIKMILVLTLIGTISGGLLSIWNDFTAPKIEAYRLQELKAAISDVLPPHDSYEETKIGGTTLYVGKKNNVNEPVGIAFRAIGSGFQGKISIMVGITPNFEKLIGIKVLEQIETPGLGTKIVIDPSKKSDPYWFPKQFKNVETSPAIEVVKNKKPTKPTEIQAITGATISSKALVRILNDSIKMVKQKFLSQKK